MRILLLLFHFYFISTVILLFCSPQELDKYPNAYVGLLYFSTADFITGLVEVSLK